MKISATEPSSALRNAAEIEEVLLQSPWSGAFRDSRTNRRRLHANLSANEKIANLNDRPLLKAYLRHCTKERTYFFLLRNVANHRAQHVFPLECQEMFLSVCIIYLIRCQVSQTKGIMSNLIIMAQTQQKTTCPLKKTGPRTRAWNSSSTTQAACI